MGEFETWVLLGVSIAVALWSRHFANKPSEPFKVRYIPYTGITFLAILLALLAVGHLPNLHGIETGRGRF